MSISLSGNNLFQVGNSTQQFVITESGALTFTAPYDSQSGQSARGEKRRAIAA